MNLFIFSLHVTGMKTLVREIKQKFHNSDLNQRTKINLIHLNEENLTSHIINFIINENH